MMPATSKPRRRTKWRPKPRVQYRRSAIRRSSSPRSSRGSHAALCRNRSSRRPLAPAALLSAGASLRPFAADDHKAQEPAQEREGDAGNGAALCRFEPGTAGVQVPQHGSCSDGHEQRKGRQTGDHKTLAEPTEHVADSRCGSSMIRQRLPILGDEAARIDGQDLTIDDRSAMPAAPGKDRVVPGSDGGNEGLIGMIATPGARARPRHAAGVRRTAWQVRSGGANQYMSVGATKYRRCDRCLGRHAGPEHRVDRRDQRSGYWLPCVVVARPCTSGGR